MDSEGKKETPIDLSKFPNLERYFRHFEDTDGAPEMQGRLPNLIVWIRLIVEPGEGEWIDPTEFFGMDEEDAEEFFSWGHNSRWTNVFWSFIQSNIGLVKEKCLELAEGHGDPNVEEYVSKANEESAGK